MTSAAHVARFGGRNGAHEVLADSGADPRLLKAMLWYTDAPPNGDITDIGPFFAGYKLPGFDTYVIQRTAADPSAARPGMVATVAVLLPVETLDIVGIERAAALLDDPPDTSRPLSVANLGPRPANVHAHAPGAAALVEALLRSRTSLWTGNGLIAAIGCLWWHLAPDDRRRLVFGAAFHPNAVSLPHAEDSLMVLTAPLPALSRWDGVTAVNAVSPPPLNPVVDRVLATEAGKPPLGAELIMAGPVPFEHWPHLMNALRLIEQLGVLNHEQVRSLLQLLGLLAPAVDQGSDIKARCLARLEELTDGCRFRDLRGLRTLPWSALEEPPRRERLVGRWCTRVVTSLSRGADFAEAILACTGEGDPFRDALRRSLSKAVKANPGQALKRLADLLAIDSPGAAVEWLAVAIGDVEAVDVALAPEVAARGDAVAWVPDLAVRHGWPRSHAVSADVVKPVDAWRRQVALGGVAGVGFDLLAARSSDEALVRAGLELDHPLLAVLAGEATARHPVLLRGTVADAGFRRVWSAAVEHGADPWVVTTPAEAAGPLLQLLAVGQPVPENLLTALADTSAADLSQHPARSRLWGQLPELARTRMLRVTADAMARRWESGDPVPEPPLATAMLADDLLGALAHDDPARALTLLRQLPGAGDDQARVVARRGRFTRDTAEQLAALVVERRWKGTAEAVVDLARHRPDLPPAAVGVSSLFSPLERFFRYLGFTAGTINVSADARDALHDLLAELYPGGPDDRAIWERAGGDLADVPRATTGRHAWGLALRMIQSGERGAPSMRRLLDEAVKEHPRNSNLVQLAQVLSAGGPR